MEALRIFLISYNLLLIIAGLSVTIFNGTEKTGLMDISFLTSPIVLFISLYLTNSIWISSTVTILCFYTLFHLDIIKYKRKYGDKKKTESLNKDDADEIKVLKFIHKIKKGTTVDWGGTFIIILVFGMFSSIPLVLFTNMKYNYAVHSLLTIILILLFSVFGEMIMTRVTDIKISKDCVCWVYGKNEFIANISEVENVEVNKFSVCIETKNNKEKIWTEEPSKVRDKIISRKI